MRVLAAAAAISLSFVLVPVSAEEPGTAGKQQAVPVQPDRTPQQSNQARDQERARGENVQIERDWKAQDDAKQAAGDRAGSATKADDSHQTVGRDWRAHPDSEQNQ